MRTERLFARHARIYTHDQLDAAMASRCTFEWRENAQDSWSPRTDYLRTLAGAIERGETDAQLRCVYPEVRS